MTAGSSALQPAASGDRRRGHRGSAHEYARGTTFGVTRGRATGLSHATAMGFLVSHGPRPARRMSPGHDEICGAEQAWHSPASVHFGTAGAIDQARQSTLTAAYHAHPRPPRTVRPTTTPPAMPAQYWINQPQDQLTTNCPKCLT